MKKKFFAALALALCASTITACAAPNQTVTFAPNWESNIISEANTATTEELSYEVKFEGQSFLNKEYYTVEYCGKDNSKPGTYTTKLEYLADNTYRYSTSLTIDVTFTLASGASATKTDRITTQTTFKKADSSLQPISSLKSVHAHSPNDYAALVLENVYNDEGVLTEKGAFTEYQYEFKIEYKDDLSGGVLTKTDLSTHKTLLLPKDEPTKTVPFSITDKKYTYLDNEQYLFALRGISSEQLASAKTVSMFNASLEAMETVATTPSSAAKTSFDLILNGGEKKGYEIEYIPLTIKTNNKDADLAQTLWYAKTTNSNDNLYRNVLLKMTVPMSYGLGSLIYTLHSANFAKE